MDFYLRDLKISDKEHMIEWMKDDEINKWFVYDFKLQTEKNVVEFIENSLSLKKEKHFAICNNNDEYLGTISLKNIDFNNKNAEYAIAMRKVAQGTGAAAAGTELVLKVAFEKFNLHKVYFNVMSDNHRAIKFYNKMGFSYEGEFINHIRKDNQYKNIKWYAKLKDEGCNIYE